MDSETNQDRSFTTPGSGKMSSAIRPKKRYGKRKSLKILRIRAYELWELAGQPPGR
jgi:hypothetical protein